ncbi:hypothetical protein MTR_1g045030 [Medicago truncatula]|uniref:Uncharacterized protein n=1 Tax=Medicago truncatula TaxID=3880 RepID=G7I650_MEDTR|nr:hypothetical protein MTR_1g045030 [Medicago truncatula]
MRSFPSSEGFESHCAKGTMTDMGQGGHGDGGAGDGESNDGKSGGLNEVLLLLAQAGRSLESVSADLALAIKEGKFRRL